MADFAYETSWFADVVVKHDAVLGATTLPNGHVRVERKNVPSITVAPLSALRIDTAVVESVLASCVPDAIALIPAESHYDWSARELAEASGSTIHTVKELYTFMRERDPRRFVDKYVRYAWDVLEQHFNVKSIEMICEASMLVKRREVLGDVVAAIEYEYEFSEEAFVRALKHHPDAQMVINANPNGGSTNAALAHAGSTKVPILGMSEAMGALNLPEAELRGYVGRQRR
jgi:hypothetical protein